MNPYTQDVINKTLPIMQQGLALQPRTQQANQANAANAFGGSRMGVQQGVTQAQGAQNEGADGGPAQPGEFRPGAAGRARRHRQQVEGRPGQPGGRA